VRSQKVVVEVVGSAGVVVVVVEKRRLQKRGQGSGSSV